MNGTLTISPLRAAFEAATKLHLIWDARLTEREEEISRQVAYGLTQTEAAEVFNRSSYTVSNTLRNVFRKVGARNIAELTVWYWCRKVGRAIDFSQPKRRIIPMLFLMLFLFYEFQPVKGDIVRRTSRQSRTETKCRGRRVDSDNDYLPEF